jgi:molybdenum transport protein
LLINQQYQKDFAMRCVLTDEQLLKLLRDDVPFGDLTTELLLTADQPTQITFAARQDMTVCCIEEAARLFELCGAKSALQVSSGELVLKGTVLLTATGRTDALFAVWKVTQILVEWASGVASATHTLVKAAGSVPVACTRKQTPRTKALSVKAVKAGGGVIHRLGLSESILLFAEHRQFLAETPEVILQRLKSQAPEHRRVVEVHDLADAKLWAKAGAEVLQMDKFSLEDVQACSVFCQENQLPVILAAAGGVNAKNAADYVAAGAGLLVTSAPYYAEPKDVQVTFG